MPHEYWELLTPSRIEVFWSHVNIKGPDDCWTWKLKIYDDGYGRFQLGKKSESAHIVCWKILNPEYVSERYVKSIDHKCRNRACVNPNHLQVVSHVANVMLGEGSPAVNARKTHCKNNHEFTSENTLITNRGKSRRCRTCYNASRRVGV